MAAKKDCWNRLTQILMCALSPESDLWGHAHDIIDIAEEIRACAVASREAVYQPPATSLARSSSLLAR
jgi:hypothetical protein